ncbi:NYN domain-containing protein [Paludisphaera rhizosphaerae]|uniref:NYN domain-containing protein n=1 Tax=Paludisphaera rhizosphaerae TaxID=2711216 RepID=UPI0013EDAEF3|nr:NYN domain-containing protein [Paludisphaera rhizosphaerae]
MSHDAPKTSRLAVLIDAENIGSRHAATLFQEIAGLGAATTRRIYGDWSQPNLAPWRGPIDCYGLCPVQQFLLRAGKNGADGALIIDAMDLLHSARFDGFCIVSSDGDFARLARRIRESGLLVFGFGQSQASQSFVRSCDRFFTLTADVVEPPSLKLAAMPPSPAGVSPALAKLARDACAAATAGDGWAPMCNVGDRIRKASPGFDPRTFGYKTLGDLIAAVGMFEIKKVPNPKDAPSQTWYIKAKQPGASRSDVPVSPSTVVSVGSN